MEYVLPGVPRQTPHGVLVSWAQLSAALACFAVLDTSTQWVTQRVVPLMALWVLFLVQMLVYGALVLRTRRLQSVRRTRKAPQLVRGVLLLAVQGLAFLSLHYLPVGEFTAVAMTTPLLVTVLAGRVLGEHRSPWLLLLVLGGLTGTLVIVRPGTGSYGWALLLPLGMVLVNTAYQLLTSWMARTEDALVTLFYTSGVSCLLLSAVLYWIWSPVTDWVQLTALLVMGLAASVGNLLFIKAFEGSSAAALMPYMYQQIGLAMLGGWLVFRHVPDDMALLGMALIAACGIAGAVLGMRQRQTPTSTGSSILPHPCPDDYSEPGAGWPGQ